MRTSLYVVAALSAGILAIYFGRGQLGGGHRLLAVLCLNAAWCLYAWWKTR
ncbi:MAG TPA: hypothetical protein QGF58_19360 [Myxococcota bacterium]|nr:hypothetical protein [Myxococcota bacterium]